MGPYPTTFPDKIRHGTTLRRSLRTLRVPIKILWGPGCQIYHSFLEWIGLYTHFYKQSFNKKKKKKNNIPASFEKQKGCFQKEYNDQNDRNAKIYRFQWSFYIFYWKTNKNREFGKQMVFQHASLFLSLYYIILHVVYEECQARTPSEAPGWGSALN